MSDSEPALRKDAVLHTLRMHWPELAQLGVAHLDLVGSLARDEAHEGSDIDLIADFTGPMDFLRFFELVDRLELLLRTRVDLMSRTALRPHWRRHFEAMAVRVA